MCDDATAAFEALQGAGIRIATEQEVLVLEIEDRPGALGEIAHGLGEARVNLTLVYLATNTRLVLAADNLADAKAADRLSYLVRLDLLQPGLGLLDRRRRLHGWPAWPRRRPLSAALEVALGLLEALPHLVTTQPSHRQIGLSIRQVVVRVVLGPFGRGQRRLRLLQLARRTRGLRRAAAPGRASGASAWVSLWP